MICPGSLRESVAELRIKPDLLNPRQSFHFLCHMQSPGHLLKTKVIGLYAHVTLGGLQSLHRPPVCIKVFRLQHTSESISPHSGLLETDESFITNPETPSWLHYTPETWGRLSEKISK